MARAPRPARIHACSILSEVAGKAHLWSFSGSDARPGPATSQPADRPLPAKLVGKGWGQLLRSRMNTVWLNDQPVFLQLVHLPTDDPNEVPAMLELQIEKLSPLPVAQVVWSYQVLPQKSVAGLPVLLLLSERGGVETALNGLEKRGCFTDRIETPLLQWVTGTAITGDGAYLFVHTAGARRDCLIGWVADGAWRTLSLVNLTTDERWTRQLVDQLNRLAWAGELEGWLPVDPTVHLITDAVTAEAWRPALEEALGRSVDVTLKPGDPELAAASAKAIISGQPRANLLPPEFAVRYRQQYTDRLWMGGLGALFAAYLIGVLIYLGVVEVQKYRQGQAADTLAQVTGVFTNTLRIKAETQVLQETVNLRYAGLDCWLATVEAMPEELVLENLAFSGGQSLVISGIAPGDQEGKITEFWQALRRKVVGNTNFFSEVQLRPTTQKIVQGVPHIQWSFSCRIQRPEI